MADHNFVFFYANAHPFSNWYMCPFEHNGKQFNCSEQAMMYYKARMFKDYDVAEMIMEQGHPRKQKFLGRQVRGFDKVKWNAECKPIMVEVLKSKFRQDRNAYEDLMETDDKIIVEASPTDTIWGIGLAENDPRALDQSTWLGTNWLGDVLMQARDELRKE
jgi:ribA/ribD-fused uncharacterized protein